MSAAGDHVGALAMSETGSGSDVVSMRCRADRQDGCYVLNGTKMWCTNGTVADTLVVYARTEQDKGAQGITAFIIEKGMKVVSSKSQPDRVPLQLAFCSENSLCLAHQD